MLVKKKYKQFKSGVYRPLNYKKFGESKCIYRSSYELKFLKWCDHHPRVSRVRYEKIVIPYICPTDGKMHKYYLDFLITMQEKNGPKNYLIEVKPFRQTIPPKPSKRKKRKTIITEGLTWAKNSGADPKHNGGKWGAAKKYCKSNDMRWCILTEKGIYIDDVFFEGNMFEA